jgi:hypothetical protein
VLPDDSPDCRACKRERLYQSLGVVTWASFLAASVETMTFFAFFDPALLGIHDIPPEWVANRMAGYTFGFFIFWAFTLCASALTAYLLPRLPLSATAPAERNGCP